MRPDRLVVICSPATEVGKTHVGARLARAAREAGATVAARKPAQSFAPEDPGTDADVLATATDEDPTIVCLPHRWYPVPLAPPMAAAELGRDTVHLADLVAELTWPEPPVTLGLVETAGGVRSPQAIDGDVVDLAHMVRPDVVVLVADAALGAINAVRLCADALAGFTVVVFLNRFDPADRTQALNRDWLAGRDGFLVCTTVTELAAAIGVPAGGEPATL